MLKERRNSKRIELAREYSKKFQNSANKVEVALEREKTMVNEGRRYMRRKRETKMETRCKWRKV